MLTYNTHRFGLGAICSTSFCKQRRVFGVHVPAFMLGRTLSVIRFLYHPLFLGRDGTSLLAVAICHKAKEQIGVSPTAWKDGYSLIQSDCIHV